MLQLYYQHCNINMKPKIYIFQRTKKNRKLTNNYLPHILPIIAQPLSHAYVREVCRLRDQKEAVESLVSLHPSERFTDTSITQKRVRFTEWQCSCQVCNRASWWRGTVSGRGEILPLLSPRAMKRLGTRLDVPTFVMMMRSVDSYRRWRSLLHRGPECIKTPGNVSTAYGLATTLPP